MTVACTEQPEVRHDHLQKTAAPAACRCRLKNSLPKPLLDMQGRTKAAAAL